MDLVSYVKDQHPMFKAVDEGHVNWEQESQFAIQSLQKNEYLAKIATQSPWSLQNAIVNVGAIGISLNPALKHAYLVPRRGEVCLDISYMGLLHLAKESGTIVFGQARLVYEKDQYENQGIDKAPVHKANTFGERGSLVGVYCTVKLPSGEYLTEEMSVAEIEKIRQSSPAKDSPWVNWYEEMARKSVVKRASKYWSAGNRIAMAVETLNSHEGLEEKVINPEPEQPEFYDEELFTKNYEKWCEILTTGRKTVEDLIALIETRAKLTDIQKASLEAVMEGETNDA